MAGILVQWPGTAFRVVAGEAQEIPLGRVRAGGRSGDELGEPRAPAYALEIGIAQGLGAHFGATANNRELERPPGLGILEPRERALAVLRAVRPRASPPDLHWCGADFLHIAGEQTRREDSAARHGSPVLVCDTDAFATCIWHERYQRCSNAELVAFAGTLPPRGLYLLTDHADVPFEDDGLRDGEHLRPWMTERFAEALATQSAPWYRLRGPRQERLSRALEHVDTALRAHLSFAAPLPKG